jgi:plastocyanin
MEFFSYYTRLVLVVSVLAGQWGLPSGHGAQPVDSSPDPEETEEDVDRYIEIHMESHAFTPSEMVVDAGSVVTFILTNQSFLVPHNFLLDDPAGNRLVDADVSSGETQYVTVTLAEPGVYPFYCDKKLLFFPDHRDQGMEGQLIVR